MTRETIEKKAEAHGAAIANRICRAIDAMTEKIGSSADVKILGLTGISNPKRRVRAKHAGINVTLRILGALQEIAIKERVAAKEVEAIIADLFKIN
jgi:hypothetical protein